MSLIIKDKIKQLMRGYPTVSDKYNVEGGIVEGDTPLAFGDMVAYGSTTGYYKKATTLTNVDEIAGFVLATNVKLEDTWGKTNDGPITNPGEAFNLFMNGFIAIALKSDATLAQIKNGAKVAVVLATAELTTADKIAADTIVELPDYEFTGIYEQQGTTLLAEVRKIC
jgi:hypothetical protein